MKRYRMVFILIVTIFILLMGLYTLITNTPQSIIKHVFKLRLPQSYKIIGYYNNYKNSPVQIKILIDSQDIIEIIKQLDDFYIPISDMDTIRIPSSKSTSSWWDLDSNINERYYMQFRDRSLFAEYTRRIWVFISDNSNGQYYLYLLG